MVNEHKTIVSSPLNEPKKSFFDSQTLIQNFAAVVDYRINSALFEYVELLF